MTAPSADAGQLAPVIQSPPRPRRRWIFVAIAAAAIAGLGVAAWRLLGGPRAPGPAPVIAAGCRSTDVADLVGCVDEARYAADLSFVGKPRPDGSEHLEKVEDLCADRLTQLGFIVERQTFGRGAKSGVNVVGKRNGTTKATELVVLGAHYDHVAECSGADDNASGVAGVLEAARVLASAQFERSLVVACWDKEEAGRLGSIDYVARAVEDKASIAVYFNFEMIGFKSSEPRSQTIPVDYRRMFGSQMKTLASNDYRGDFVLAVADDAAREHLAAVVRHAKIVELPVLEVELPATTKNKLAIAHLRRSDHASFWERDYPAVMLTDTAEFRNPRYHCAHGDDSADVLDARFASNVVASTLGAIAEALGPLPR